MNSVIPDFQEKFRRESLIRFRRGLQNPRRMPRMQLASLNWLQIIVANDDSYALAA
jgi:hypothetical protein